MSHISESAPTPQRTSDHTDRDGGPQLGLTRDTGTDGRTDGRVARAMPVLAGARWARAQTPIDLTNRAVRSPATN